MATVARRPTPLGLHAPEWISGRSHRPASWGVSPAWPVISSGAQARARRALRRSVRLRRDLLQAPPQALPLGALSLPTSKSRIESLKHLNGINVAPPTIHRTVRVPLSLGWTTSPRRDRSQLPAAGRAPAIGPETARSACSRWWAMTSSRISSKETVGCQPSTRSILLRSGTRRSMSSKPSP